MRSRSKRSRYRGVSLVIGTLASVLLMPSWGSLPAGAQDTTAPPDAVDALVAVEFETMLLVELDAFEGRLPPKVVEADQSLRGEVDGFTRSEMIDWLHSSDADGVKELALLDGRTVLSPDVRQALTALPSDVVRAIEAGTRIAVPPTVYEHALNDLEFRHGGPPGRPAGGTPGPSVAPAAESGRPVGTIAIATGAAVLLAGGLWLGRRRRRDPRNGRLDGSVAQLLDASRRLGSSVDAAEIHRILLAESVSLTDADDGAVVLTALPDGTTAATSAATVVAADSIDLDLARLDRGAVRRVLDTGVAVRSLLADPAWGGEQRAVLIVPLVRGGVLAGAVIVTRTPDRPFEPFALDVLAQLVPMAAAALVSAGLHDDVAELSLTDGLTDLGNRRRLDRDLLATLAAGTGSVGFVMVDIDHFKHFNDTHGHVAGDEVLRQVASLLRAHVRTGDVVYRYGGEEFCVLLPDATPGEAAEVSERLRQAVELHEFAGAETQPGGRLTISVGTTVAQRTDPTDIKQRADHALYEAKHQGRNRVVVDGHTEG